MDTDVSIHSHDCHVTKTAAIHSEMALASTEKHTICQNLEASDAMSTDTMHCKYVSIFLKKVTISVKRCLHFS